MVYLHVHCNHVNVLSSRENKLCEILANCETLDLPSARTWVSGETNCSLPQCDIAGVCQV